MRASLLVFFQSQGCDLQKAREHLLKQGLTVSAVEGGLVAGRPGCPQFSVKLNRDPHVYIEAREIAAGTEHEAGMMDCGARFEVLIEDLDEALDEFNTLMEVEVGLQEASSGYVFLPWNGTLSATLSGEP